MISLASLFLEVDTSKLTAEQKSIYRKEIKAAHPDTGGSKEAFQKTTDKWEKLSKPSSSTLPTIQNYDSHVKKDSGTPFDGWEERLKKTSESVHAGLDRAAESIKKRRDDRNASDEQRLKGSIWTRE